MAVCRVHRNGDIITPDFLKEEENSAYLHTLASSPDLYYKFVQKSKVSHFNISMLVTKLEFLSRLLKGTLSHWLWGNPLILA